jgi:hypothetical protein
MASSSGTRRSAGVSCGSTRRILTLFHFSTNFATLPLISGVQTIFTVSHAARFTFGFVAFALPGVENPQKNRDEVPFALNTLRENWLRS